MPNRVDRKCSICGYYRHSKNSTCIRAPHNRGVAAMVNAMQQAAAPTSHPYIRMQDYPNINWRRNVMYSCYAPAQIGVNKYYIYSHDRCPRVSKFLTCECPCHEATKDIDMPTKQTTNANLRGAAITLNSALKLLESELEIRPTLIGRTVQQAYFGHMIETYDFLFTPEKFLRYYLDNKLQSNYDSKNYYYEFSLTDTYGTKKYRMFIAPDTPKEWNIEQLCFEATIGFSNNVANGLSLTSVGTRSNNPKETLERGLEYAKTYSLNIDQRSLEILAERINALQPPPEVNEVLIGFRAYKVQDGYLYGMHNAKWESRELTVTCPEFTQHIKSVGADWRQEAGQHECGIYMHKDPAVCLYEVKGTQAIALVYAYGVVGDFDKGYRAEKCEIQKLWVFTDDSTGKAYSPEIKPGVYDCEVIVNCRPSDFLYSPEVMQWAGRNVRS